MADTTITALTGGTTLAGTEVAPFDQSGATVKITATQIKTWTSASPTLVTPALGTPSSGTLTSCTGLPAASVVAGSLGTGNYVVTGTATLNPAVNTTGLIISGGSITGSGTTVPGMTVAGTLNTSGVVAGAGLYCRLTDTAHGVGSTLFDFGVGSTPLVYCTIGSGTTESTEFVVVNEHNSAGGLYPRGITASEHSSQAHSAHVGGRRSRGTSASPTVVAVNDYTGSFVADAYNGSAYVTVGFLSWIVTAVSGSNLSVKGVLNSMTSGGAAAECLSFTQTAVTIATTAQLQVGANPLNGGDLTYRVNSGYDLNADTTLFAGSNASTGTAARALIKLENSSSNTTLQKFGANYTTNGLLTGGLGCLANSAGDFLFRQAAADWIFSNNGFAAANETFRVKNGGGVIVANGTAIPAGGTAGLGYRVSSTSNFGMFFGSGAPSLAAAKGSLYLRSDGSGIADRCYVNTDGSTTWTNLVTAA
jgi:hypothetical protein